MQTINVPRYLWRRTLVKRRSGRCGHFALLRVLWLGYNGHYQTRSGSFLLFLAVGRSSVTSTGGKPAGQATCPAIEQFTLWALETLELPVQSELEGVFRVELPQQALGAGADRPVRFCFSSNGGGAEGVETLHAASPLVQWLIERLRQVGPILHAAPRNQPVSVHQIIPNLFQAYQVEGGGVRLSGCQIEDRPLLRLTYRPDEPSGEGQPRQLVQVFAHPDGEPVPGELVTALHLEDLQPPAQRRFRISDAEVRQWSEAAVRRARQRGHVPEGQPELVTVIWCKYVEGRLSFAIDQQTAQLAFEGWAQLLADRQAVPPPYICPWTGRSSYHLAATDEGQVTVAEAISTCAASGARVLSTQLQECALSGKQALPPYMHLCPVTQSRLLRSLSITCPMCRQRVSPAAMQRGKCAACRSLRRVSKDDPRMARVLGEHSRLDRWRRWRMAETGDAYILLTQNLWQRLLVVLDKQTLRPLHTGLCGRLLRRWEELSEADRAEFFREAD